MATWRAVRGIRGYSYEMDISRGRLTAKDGGTSRTLQADGHEHYYSITLYNRQLRKECHLILYTPHYLTSLIHAMDVPEETVTAQAAREILPLHKHLRKQGLPDNLRQGLEALFQEAEKAVTTR